MDYKQEELYYRASNKAFSRFSMAQKDVYRIKKELKSGITGGLSQEEAEGLLTAQDLELQVWKFIYELIEKHEV